MKASSAGLKRTGWLVPDERGVEGWLFQKVNNRALDRVERQRPLGQEDRRHGLDGMLLHLKDMSGLPGHQGV